MKKSSSKVLSLRQETIRQIGETKLSAIGGAASQYSSGVTRFLQTCTCPVAYTPMH